MTTQEYAAAYRARNREKLAENARLRYHAWRREVFELLGSSCKLCGFSDTRALEIDHVVPKARTGRKQWHQEIVHLRANPQEYQMLCANCHTIKSRGEY